MSGFEIPVVLFLFRRKDKIPIILERIAQAAPKKIYLIADGPRDEDEIPAVLACRRLAEECITWRCQIIRNYASKNRGVFSNIGLGARWVLEREECAIFLEDDNLPEITFFPYCRELIYRYWDDTRILWICGTNYLQRYEPKDGSDYVFTKHLMPCGWASWKSKYNRFYDGYLTLMENEKLLLRMKDQYEDKRLYEQQLIQARMEKERLLHQQKPTSWDYQMCFALRANNLYGISPKYNQIQNVGVDQDSVHGGSRMSDEMTRRFCSIKSYPLIFPLTHPATVLPDEEYERRVGKIILFPWRMRLKMKVSLRIKRIFHIPFEASIKELISSRLFH